MSCSARKSPRPAQVQEGRATAAAQPPPGRGRDRVEVDAEVLDHGNLLGRRPVQIGIDQVAKISLAAGSMVPHRSRDFSSRAQRLAHSAKNTNAGAPGVRPQGGFIDAAGSPIRQPAESEEHYNPGRT